MKISPELRQALMTFLTYTKDHPEEKISPADATFASQLLSGLEYKKRGRKIGWRKYKKVVDTAS